MSAVRGRGYTALGRGLTKRGKNLPRGAARGQIKWFIDRNLVGQNGGENNIKRRQYGRFPLHSIFTEEEEESTMMNVGNKSGRYRRRRRCSTSTTKIIERFIFSKKQTILFKRRHPYVGFKKKNGSA